MSRRLMLRNASGGGGLPSEYTAIDYVGVKARGNNNYIPVDVVIGTVTKAELDLAKYDYAKGGSGPIALCAINSSNTLTMPFGSVNNSQATFVCSPSFAVGTLFPRQILTFTKSKGTQTHKTAFLGWSNAQWAGLLKLYGVKMYSDDALVLDAVPALRNADQEIGLYDFVLSEFYPRVGINIDYWG